MWPFIVLFHVQYILEIVSEADSFLSYFICGFDGKSCSIYTDIREHVCHISNRKFAGNDRHQE